MFTDHILLFIHFESVSRQFYKLSHGAWILVSKLVVFSKWANNIYPYTYRISFLQCGLLQGCVLIPMLFWLNILFSSMCVVFMCSESRINIVSQSNMRCSQQRRVTRWKTSLKTCKYTVNSSVSQVSHLHILPFMVCNAQGHLTWGDIGNRLVGAWLLSLRTDVDEF